ncbi:MAG: enoyl-CoA hydratase/isomerase family protein [Chloroflexi bacterium]|nr:enoyl-CoA hydratase/isomerase family protein [Chloroflexota bacterium]MDA1002240.1 enoyl-CoA hydratase/isomerase family protein [Chloroflexota bacterium]
MTTTAQRPVPESKRDASKRYTPDGFEVPAPSENDVLYEARDGIAWITLNRPLVLNAVDWSLTLHFGRAVERAATDGDVRVVIIRGAGRAFSAGGDLQSSPRPEGLEIPGMPEIMRRVWQMPKPVIAAVRGHAVGQGCEIAGMCDLTIAAEDAKFGEIQVRHGFGPPLLITPFTVGLKAAKELLLLGEIVEAPEALRMGLVNRVVPGDQLDDAAETMARRLASLPATAVALNKLLVNRVYELAAFDEALNYRDVPELVELSGRTRDDGVAADRLRTLSERGWEAFKEQRDQAFRE